jgi:DNA-binding transcriptional LysR family regulator
MGVTQSAMSNSLSQLRLLFEDPLFRRTPRGIEPTPRALELGEPIRRGLGLFDREGKADWQAAGLALER